MDLETPFTRLQERRAHFHGSLFTVLATSLYGLDTARHQRIDGRNYCSYACYHNSYKLVLLVLAVSQW